MKNKIAKELASLLILVSFYCTPCALILIIIFGFLGNKHGVSTCGIAILVLAVIGLVGSFWGEQLGLLNNKTTEDNSNEPR